MINNGVINNSLTRGNKAEIVGWGMPDYSNRSSFAENTQMTATEPCCIYGTLYDILNVGAYLVINGQQINSVQQAGDSCSFFFILDKGDTYLVRSSGVDNYVCPLKGV